MAQLGIPLSTVQDVFLTHLHSDHVNGLTDLWLTGWIPGGGGRTVPFKVRGPSGTQEMMRHLSLAHAADIRMRIADQALPQRGAEVESTDISEGVIYNRVGVRVTAFEVNHGEALKPAFGYRIDYQGRSVVISGDTQPSENLARYAKGTDVLVHEVMAARAEYLASSPAQQVIMAHHTSPEQAGRIFTDAKPRLAVFTHIVLNGDARVSAPSVQDLIVRTRSAYGGPLEVGEDLMRIDVVSASVQKDK
jgi:ribonuclease Z